MDLVWYVSYGSNMHADRFACYIAGGTPDGGNRCYPGCRDTTEPRQAKGFEVRGRVYFATESPVWQGGRAFFDQNLLGETYVRAYLITKQQFADVWNQEMYREPGTTDLDLREVLTSGRAKLGEGRYETLIFLGERDGCPMLTFTAPWSFGEEPLVAPSGSYLRMLGHGLISTHGWSLRKTADYLSELRGVTGVWSSDEIIPMLYPYVVLSCAATAGGRIGPVEELLSSSQASVLDDMATVVDVAGPTDLGSVLHDLAENDGIRRARVACDWATCTRFLTAGLADELEMVVSSTSAGDLTGDWVSPNMTQAGVRQSGDPILLRHVIQRWEVRTHPEVTPKHAAEGPRPR